MANWVKDADYKCRLGDTELAKARKELGENPDTRMLEIKQLRTRLEKVPGLKARTDVPFLLAFLRARKFDQEKAFNLVTHHYREKQEKRSHYEDIKPSKVRHVIDSGMVAVLEHRDADGCRVVLVRPGRWEPDRYPVSDAIKLLFIVLSKLSEEEETQVNGIHVIDLLDNLTWKQATHVTPSMAKLLAGTLQDMLPLRLKRYDFVHEPSLFHTVFPIFKSFMKDKLVQRIKMNGDNLDDLHANMLPDHLPTDLGGKLEPYLYNKKWMSKLMTSEKEFEANNKYGYLSMGLEDSKREENKADASLQGLGGTFKKLDV